MRHLAVILVLFHVANCIDGNFFQRSHHGEMTSDEIQDAFQKALYKLEKNKEEKTLFKELGLNEQRNSPAGRVNRVNKQRKEAERRIDLAKILEEVTKALIKTTGKSVDELEKDSTLRKAIGKEFFQSILEVEEESYNDNDNDENFPRVKRQTDIADDLVDAVCESQSRDLRCKKVSKRYRTVDGSCNNLQHPEWGMVFATEPRYEGMSPVFADGDPSTDGATTGKMSAPRVSIKDKTPLPSARHVSNMLFRYKRDQKETTNETFNTLMSFNWGQFLDHDMVLTPLAGGGGEGSGPACCLGDEPLEREECMAIEIPDDDEFYDRKCMNFVRSAPALQQSICELGPRQVMNELTSFIDGSTVYGSMRGDYKILRNYSRGLLDSVRTRKGQEMFPKDDEGICEIHGNDTREYYCSKAGDIRVDVQPGLSGTHLLFLREHNRLAALLREKRPEWSDNKLFQEARKIVGAIIQHITYTDYMNNVLNEETRRKYDVIVAKSGYVKTYDPNINPTIRNAFAAAAYRFGHSMIPAGLAYLLQDWNTVIAKKDLLHLFLDPRFLASDEGSNVTNLARYMIKFPAKKVDRFFESAIRNTLFGGLDLTALNIQRGRDHGLPPYVEWRKYCNLTVPTDYPDLIDHTPFVQKRLRLTYSDIRDIDLYAGAMTEKRLVDSYVGPTFACLIGEQFRALRKGDRFWYENQGREGFTPEQLAEIRKVRLSKVLCNNLGIGQAQPNVFRQNSTNNPIQDCNLLEDMSLDPWGQRKQ